MDARSTISAAARLTYMPMSCNVRRRNWLWHRVFATGSRREEKDASEHWKNPRAGRGGVKLTWADNLSNETGFYVERAPIGSASFARIGQVPANAATFLDTPGFGRFTYRVQAFSSSTGQASAYSNQAVIRVR